jgi:anti-anti-sigma factor
MNDIRISSGQEQITLAGSPIIDRPASKASRSATGLSAQPVLQFTGYPELTAANAPFFRENLAAALNGQTVIEIDLAETRVMDCAGFGALIALRNLPGFRHGVVRLVNPTPAVLQMLDLLQAAQAFEIVKRTTVAWHDIPAAAVANDSWSPMVLHAQPELCQAA